MFSAWATATLDGNILTFNVESGEETYSNVLTSSIIEGIVKTGAGTIILDTASTSFTGGKPITISGGAIEIQNANALGSGNIVTVANGATFRMVYSSGNGKSNDIVLQGGLLIGAFTCRLAQQSDGLTLLDLASPRLQLR